MKIAQYIRALRFRPYEDGDLEVCLRLWRGNEGTAFPTGYEEWFIDSLRRREQTYLLGEWEGEVICGGGIDRAGSNEVWLAWGLVEPGRQRCGFGTTLLLARLALLRVGEAGCTARMVVTPNSCTFYGRFGFESSGIRPDPEGNLVADFSRRILPAEVEMCRGLLAAGGAILSEGCVLEVA